MSTTLFFGGCGFESITCFLRVMSLSPHICFLGVGEFFLIMFCLGGGGGFTLIS